jgi:hypothetical protein
MIRLHTPRTPAQKAARAEKDRARSAQRREAGLPVVLHRVRKNLPTASGRPSEASRRDWYKSSYWYTHRRAAGSMLTHWQAPDLRQDGTESSYVARYNPTLPALHFLDRKE